MAADHWTRTAGDRESQRAHSPRDEQAVLEGTQAWLTWIGSRKLQMIPITLKLINWIVTWVQLKSAEMKSQTGPLLWGMKGIDSGEATQSISTHNSDLK